MIFFFCKNFYFSCKMPAGLSPDSKCQHETIFYNILGYVRACVWVWFVTVSVGACWTKPKSSFKTEKYIKQLLAEFVFLFMFVFELVFVFYWLPCLLNIFVPFLLMTSKKKKKIKTHFILSRAFINLISNILKMFIYSTRLLSNVIKCTGIWFNI